MGNISVQGMVLYKGQPVKNQSVFLMKHDYDSMLDSLHIHYFETKTNDSGVYHFRQIPSGFYNIESQIDSNHVMGWETIHVQNHKSVYENLLLSPSKTLSISVPNDMYAKDLYFYVPGTQFGKYVQMDKKNKPMITITYPSTRSNTYQVLYRYMSQKESKPKVYMENLPKQKIKLFE